MYEIPIVVTETIYLSIVSTEIIQKGNLALGKWKLKRVILAKEVNSGNLTDLQ